MTVSIQFQYVILLFALFVLPRILIRFRIPTAVTSFAIGVLCTEYDLFVADQTITLLSMFGIVSLFLLAGLEADLKAFRYETSVITQHLVFALISLLGFGFLLWYYGDTEFRPALLIGLAILTPSTGFILDSIHALQMDQDEKFWIKTKAIATEILALIVLFVVLKSSSLEEFGVSTGILLVMILGLPIVLWIFSKWVVPYAPRSEFAFLLVTATVCAFLTKKLGVYYLVGAFIVGLAAQRFRKNLPSIASENMLHAVEFFSSFFVPFYFFYAGLNVQKGDFTKNAIVLGGLLLLVFVPLRALQIMVHRRVVMKEKIHRSIRISVTMTPTLVFTLVIANILRDRFAIDPAIFGGLILYAIFNTMIPSFLFHDPTPEYESHQLDDLDYLDIDR
ncbi:MAG: cation:proton antiporter [Bdellovibrionales bacterium]|nr:cation:proton antiporter [Bdellovibrionales bacterium]